MGHSAQLWLVIVDVETFALEDIILHSEVVVGANGVHIGPIHETLELLFRVVHLEYFFDAVVVVSHVVSVLVNSQRTVNLILKHF